MTYIIHEYHLGNEIRKDNTSEIKYADLVPHFCRKQKGKTSLRSGRRQQQDNIKVYTYIRETECDGKDWINLARDTVQSRAVVDNVTSLCVPYRDYCATMLPWGRERGSLCLRCRSLGTFNCLFEL
jgi:hypothetical protein